MKFSSCQSNVAARARFQSRSRWTEPTASADHGKRSGLRTEYESASESSLSVAEGSVEVKWSRAARRSALTPLDRERRPASQAAYAPRFRHARDGADD